MSYKNKVCDVTIEKLRFPQNGLKNLLEKKILWSGNLILARKSYR